MAPKRGKSVDKTLASGEVKSFSSYQDHVAYLLGKGEIQSEAELLGSKRELLSSILFSWVIQGQLACVFARALAKDPALAGWLSVVVDPGPDLPQRIQPTLEAAKDSAHAIQFILPGLTTPSHCAQLIHTLCNHPSWSWEEIPPQEPLTSPAVLVGLRWKVPSSKYESWVLGIAPFTTMPFTRRFEGAPFMALALRPSTPPAWAPPTDVVHLAHMEDGLQSQDQRDLYTHLTKEWKAKLLVDDSPSTARARVTFTLPESLRASLPPSR